MQPLTLMHMDNRTGHTLKITCTDTMEIGNCIKTYADWHKYLSNYNKSLGTQTLGIRFHANFSETLTERPDSDYPCIDQNTKNWLNTTAIFNNTKVLLLKGKACRHAFNYNCGNSSNCETSAETEWLQQLFEPVFIGFTNENGTHINISFMYPDPSLRPQGAIDLTHMIPVLNITELGKQVHNMSLGSI